MGAIARPTVPLTKDEKDLLLLIYIKRRNLLAAAYFVLITLAFFASLRGGDNRSRYNGKVTKWEQDPDSKYVSRMGMWMINLGVLETVIISTGVFFYFKRVRPFKKDYKEGVKEAIPYTVIRKAYFPAIDKYYLSFDDPKYLHHQVEPEIYDAYGEGDVFYVYRAPRSKYAFRPDGRYTL